MNISRIELFCDDRKVGEITRLLAGLALQPPKIHPVINAEVQAGKLTAGSNGQMVVLFASWLKKHKLTNVNAGDVKRFLQDNGRTAASYSYVLKQAQAMGVVRKAGGKGTKMGYEVLGVKPAKANKKGSK